MWGCARSAPARSGPPGQVGPDHGTEDEPTAAVSRTNATRYARASETVKGLILDEVCAMTGWRPSHAHKALGVALGPVVVRPRHPARRAETT